MIIMKTVPLETENPSIHLVEPVLERDALLGVHWLEGDIGRNTLQLMGVSKEYNKESTIEKEKERVTEFIEDKSQLNWMIEYDGQVVGTVWADLEPKHGVPSPSIHIMIGDSTVRGKNVGFTASSRVVKYLEEMGQETIYSRHLAENTKAKDMLRRLGFKDMGEPYIDQDGLEWQNVER
jgi:RimJ/RimL family protein N-acetyltransferase